MLIVPDTEALFHDKLLKDWRIQAILANEPDTGLRLSVPEVVWDELRGQIQRRAEEINRAISKLFNKHSDARGLFGSVETFLITDERLGNTLDDFDKRREEFNVAGRTLGYPNVSPEELSRRSIERRRPFTEGDRGMRDTLIWLAVMEYLRGQPTNSDPKVLLITENKDFLNGDKDGLHEDLVEDLLKESIPATSVIVRLSLGTVISEFVQDKLAKVEWVKAEIDKGSVLDFTEDDDTLGIVVNDWFWGNAESVEHSSFWSGDYLYFDYDIVDHLELTDVQTPLLVEDSVFIVTSTWRGVILGNGIIADLGDMTFHDSLRVEVKIQVTSVIEDEKGKLLAKAHGIGDVKVMSIENDYSSNDLHWQ